MLLRPNPTHVSSANAATMQFEGKGTNPPLLWGDLHVGTPLPGQDAVHSLLAQMHQHRKVGINYMGSPMLWFTVLLALQSQHQWWMFQMYHKEYITWHVSITANLHRPIETASWTLVPDSEEVRVQRQIGLAVWREGPIKHLLWGERFSVRMYSHRVQSWALNAHSLILWE